MKTTFDWYSILENYKKEWEELLLDLDNKVRNTYFVSNDKLPEDVIILAAYFHANFMATYMSKVITNRPQDFPPEMIELILNEAKSFGESHAGLLFSKDDDKVADYEPQINMKGGDA